MYASHHGAAPTNTHPGMFSPGTKVQVGKHRVIVEKYLSEGGFAHVYLVRDPTGGPSNVLKRVAVPDKDALQNMRTEVETMKKLKGHKHIVTYIDSHASQLQGGGYEVFLLMEFCNGGGLIDFMNTRLQHRLTEPEILKIFSDVALGVACMHYLKPPLLHRDLKVENVLITTSSTSSSGRTYKLCDFGSAAQPRPAAKNAAEGRLIEDDIQRHTTLQYRSPEMIDVYRRQPIDEKSDIWALGVLLYKLCYYTTPFEDVGQMAILNASFKFPSYPSFSDKLKKLISSMLKENPTQRPNIYQVVKEVSGMRGGNCPIEDIYAKRTQSETRRYEQLPTSPDVASAPPIGISKLKSPELPSQTALPDITPMRRGRPTSTNPAQLSVSARVTPAGSRGTSSDPFAALDSKDYNTRVAAVDELAGKFPSLDEFSLLHDQGSKFSFDDTGSAPNPKRESINKKLTDALADEAFGVPPPKPPRTSSLKPTGSAPTSKTSSTTDLRRNVSLRKTAGEATAARAAQSQPSGIHEPIPIHKKSNMVSTGVGASPPPTPSPPKRFDVSNRPAVWRVPAATGDERSASQPTPKQPISSFDAELPPRPEKSGARPSVLELSRTKSATLGVPKSPASARTSLDVQRPSGQEIERARSANSARPRPVSAYLDGREPEDYDKPLPPRPENRPEPRRSSSAVESSDDEGPENVSGGSNLSFLKDMESNHSRRRSSGKSHRKGVPSISLSGTAKLVTGRFGDAFKKFEGGGAHGRQSGGSGDEEVHESHHRHGSHGHHGHHRDSHHSSNNHATEDLRPRVLTPIAGSVATGASDDIAPLEETEDLPPELRRELERQQLEQEERRVAAAAAAYKNRVADPRNRAVAEQKGSAIQNRVKELLDNSKEVRVTRTAEGYGKFTEDGASDRRSPVTDRPPVARKPVGMTRPPGSINAAVANATGPRPMVAAKPKALRTGSGAVPQAAPTSSLGLSPSDEDWEANFQKRYPSLAGLEMVETEVRPAARVKDV